MESILEFPVAQPACQNRQFPFLIKCYLYFTHSEMNDAENARRLTIYLFLALPTPPRSRSPDSQFTS